MHAKLASPPTVTAPRVMHALPIPYRRLEVNVLHAKMVSLPTVTILHARQLQVMPRYQLRVAYTRVTIGALNLAHCASQPLAVGVTEAPIQHGSPTVLTCRQAGVTVVIGHGTGSHV